MSGGKFPNIRQCVIAAECNETLLLCPKGLPSSRNITSQYTCLLHQNSALVKQEGFLWDILPKMKQLPNNTVSSLHTPIKTGSHCMCRHVPISNRLLGPSQSCQLGAAAPGPASCRQMLCTYLLLTFTGETLPAARGCRGSPGLTWTLVSLLRPNSCIIPPPLCSSD